MNIAVTLALLPLAFAGDGGDGGGDEAGDRGADVAVASQAAVEAVAPSDAVQASSTSTTTSPTTSPTTTEPPPPPGRFEEGRATWYDTAAARPGHCAHKTLPLGTLVTVTNTATGRSVRCTVADRGPYVPGYVVDLHREDFLTVAPATAAWFPARLTW